ncbi:hypothetical protein OG762_51500 (plasmid) [Streptomyces sp. NBC_01136]|uniref:hypothetical protein n=1 Tax=Streptomyces sp. NBC_01136 TaxID=2903754 RepID=UPI002F9182E2|nr:hypothetical protein OG762_51500 [Streptomyces sp. NBC_01136]
MLRVEDLPDPVDAPEAQGPLSSDEVERWELCKRSFEQYQQAWWVAARALDISLRGRLWRAEYDTAEAFIGDVAGMSTSNAYRQIAGAEVAAVLASPPRFELESNDLSRMRDSAEVRDPEPEQDPEPEPLVISQRAAEALTRVREDYGATAAADTYRTVAEVTGKDKVSQKTITGIVQQLPRKKDAELSEDELKERVRTLAVKQTEKEAAEKEAATDPVEVFRKYVAIVEAFAEKTGGMSAAYEKAAGVDKAKADEIAKQVRDHMARAAENFPDV